jgi:hypothetical protein
MNTIVIAPEFCGPRDSGNGGYVCGLIANYADFDSAVILRKPPPLSKPLSVITVKDKVSLMDGDQLIGEAIPAATSVMKTMYSQPALYAVQIGTRVTGFGYLRGE